jgi:hypothetical protein
MVKHDRYQVEPNQSCLVFAKEGSLPVIGASSPMGPKGEFGMRLAGTDDKFTILYNHPPYGRLSTSLFTRLSPIRSPA